MSIGAVVVVSVVVMLLLRWPRYHGDGDGDGDEIGGDGQIRDGMGMGSEIVVGMTKSEGDHE